MDSFLCNLLLGVDGCKDWIFLVGVLENNFISGFLIMLSLVLNVNNRYCYGLGDILFYFCFKAIGSVVENK